MVYYTVYRYKEKVNNSRNYEESSETRRYQIILLRTNEIRKLKHHIYRIETS